MLTNRPEIGEINGLVEPSAYHAVDRQEVVPWTAKGLKITRLRLLSDPGFPFWDVSYCHGVCNGRNVTVELPFSQIPKYAVSGFIVKMAKRDGVYAKGLGIFSAISTLN